MRNTVLHDIKRKEAMNCRVNFKHQIGPKNVLALFFRPIQSMQFYLPIYSELIKILCYLSFAFPRDKEPAFINFECAVSFKIKGILLLNPSVTNGTFN